MATAQRWDLASPWAERTNEIVSQYGSWEGEMAPPPEPGTFTHWISRKRAIFTMCGIGIPKRGVRLTLNSDSVTCDCCRGRIT